MSKLQPRARPWRARQRAEPRSADATRRQRLSSPRACLQFTGRIETCADLEAPYRPEGAAILSPGVLTRVQAIEHAAATQYFHVIVNSKSYALSGRSLQRDVFRKVKTLSSCPFGTAA